MYLQEERPQLQSTEGCLCSRPKRLHLPLSQYSTTQFVVCWKVFRALGRCSLAGVEAKGRKEGRTTKCVPPAPRFHPSRLESLWVSSSSCIIICDKGSWGPSRIVVKAVSSRSSPSPDCRVFLWSGCRPNSNDQPKFCYQPSKQAQ